MSIQSIISNEIAEDAHGVWVLSGHKEFGYSDGAGSEAYLERVFRKCTDLGSSSTELESWIKDWPSEYHLTSRRAQLLSGFKYDRSLKVLEVGGGCGAITRFLGETFDDVVTVEGSISRARLARLRTRDLSGVKIISAPFQEMKFTRKFDVIFCIGVYEYSSSFVDGPDPFDSVLAYFRDLLAPDGHLVLAIENQFGLKYFAGLSEDHLGTAYSGICGYHAMPGKVRTFGKMELESNIRQHFATTEFFFPYPDYKIPNCVVDEQFLIAGGAGELVAGRGDRDYSAGRRPAWPATDVTLELSRNGVLPFFSNSFLVVAGRSAVRGRIEFPQHVFAANTSRRPEFRTVTRIVGGAEGVPNVIKQLKDGSARRTIGRLTLAGTRSDWVGGASVDLQCYLLSRDRSLPLADLLRPAITWVSMLEQHSMVRGGRRFVPGRLLDATWQNTFVSRDGPRLIDQEWSWKDEVPFNVLIIRAIFYFVTNCEERGFLAPVLAQSSGRKLIDAAAAALGVSLEPGDFGDFIALESEVQALASGTEARRHVRSLQWFMTSRKASRGLRDVRNFLRRVRGSLEARTGISLGSDS